MANLLLIETATDVCSIGLSIDDQLVALHESNAYNEHGKQITLLIEACLREAQVEASALDAIAISSGPGSFTSLRIGTATAKGLCYALDKPLIAIDTLHALAIAAFLPEDEDCNYIPMIDARSMGVFFSIFDAEANKIKALGREKLESYDLSDFYSKEKKLIFCGSAAKKYQTVLEAENIDFRPDIVNSAKNLLPLAIKAYKTGLWEDLAYYEPNYLAPPNITTSKKKQPKKLI